MPGARYDGDLIIQLRGNKDLARQYVGEARKVMGFVLQDAEVNNLGVHQIKRYAHDGTEIVAEKIGDLKRVRITPPGGPGRNKPVRIFEDLVIGLIDRSEGGGSVNWPPLIISPQEEDVLIWRTFFYDDGAPGFYEGAGSYSDVFPKADQLDNREQLPPANTVWYDADGRYCAWLSAVNHITPPSRHPDNLYGVRVVALGRNVIDMRSYEFATSSFNSHKVLSACIRGRHVYIMAALLGRLYFTPRPAVVPGGDAWASEKWAQDEFEYVLLRIPLAEVTDEVTGQLYYNAVNEAEDVLWSGTLERAYSAWRFSTDGRRLVNVQLPTSGFLYYKMETLTSTVVNDSVVHEILISEDGSSASMNTYDAENVIYDDGDATLELERVGTGAFDFVSGSYRWPAVRSTETEVTVRRIAHADPRNGRFYMHERDARNPTVDPLDSSNVYHDVTIRDIVFEDGAEWYQYEETESKRGGRRPTNDPEIVQNYVTYCYSVAFAAIDVGGPGGYYAGCVGVVDFKTSDDTFPWPGFIYADVGILNTCLIAQMFYNKSTVGLANGGMSLSRHRITAGSPAPMWANTVGYAPGDSIDPQYFAQQSVELYTASVSNARYMFVQSNSALYFLMSSSDERWDYRPTYLTDGDFEALASIANDVSYVLDCYILGKPLKAQKYNIPVRIP